MPFDIHRRIRVPEQMDADNADPAELTRALRFLRRINKLLGYNKSVLKRVRAVAGTTAGPLSILDVATGSGDLLQEIRGMGVSPMSSPAGRPCHAKLIGLDRHAMTTAEAATLVGDAQFIRGDALALPFADASVDIITCNLFLHHLSDDEAVAALREMARVASKGIAIADLLRTRRAYAWITAFTLFSSKMAKHDARASVGHAFTLQEARSLFDRAGLSTAKLEVTFGHRFIATWSRPSDAPR